MGQMQEPTTARLTSEVRSSLPVRRAARWLLGTGVRTTRVTARRVATVTSKTVATYVPLRVRQLVYQICLVMLPRRVQRNVMRHLN